MEITSNFAYNNMTEVQQAEFQAWLVNHLRSHPVTVIFRKKNNELREMQCTLETDKLPVITHTEKSQTRRDSPEVCRVFDTERAAWRSFRWDSICRVEIL